MCHDVIIQLDVVRQGARCPHCGDQKVPGTNVLGLVDAVSDLDNTKIQSKPLCFLKFGPEFDIERFGESLPSANVSAGFHYPAIVSDWEKSQHAEYMRNHCQVRPQYSTLHLQIRVNSGNVCPGLAFCGCWMLWRGWRGIMCDTAAGYCMASDGALRAGEGRGVDLFRPLLYFPVENTKHLYNSSDWQFLLIENIRISYHGI